VLLPVILEPESYDLGLDPGFSKTEPLLDLLKPCPPQSMRSWRVGSRVNSVVNDDAERSAEYCPAPVPIPPQGALFQD
jgi:putative SOS response-associated peptidase YedK